jgi:Carboxypeptidase regulatory-like domain
MARIISLLLLLVCAGGLWAAEPAGSIAGTITDPSGGAVANAKITVTATATGLTRTAQSSADGGYLFPLLPVGNYSVVVEASGFKRFEQRPVEVRADASANVPVGLQIGAATESVTVEANAQMVETRSGTISQVVGQQKIVELPLNGRNAASLVLLSAGTADLNTGNSRGSGDAIQGGSYPGAQSITSNGSRSDGVNYHLDGGSNIDHYTNVNNPFPNPDALEEFSVQTNSYSAEFGRASGAIVNVVTKSGTNEFHGDAFEFLRNGVMNSRNFFAPIHDKLKRNQFGGTAGGRIIRDKLFFFGTYQGTQIRNISEGNSAVVLTQAQKNGNFSGLTRQLIDPVTKAPFPGNQIPTSRFDPIVTKLLPFIPAATSPDGLITFAQPLAEHENQFMGRVDYNLTKQRLYGRYFYAKYPRDAFSGGGNLVASRGGFEFFDQSASVGHTFSISPNLVNNFIASWNYNDGNALSGSPFSLQSLGLPIAGQTPPEIRIEVTGFFTINTGAPGEFRRENYHFTDSVHWIRGSHEIAFGGDFLRMKVDLINSFRQGGRFRFRGTAYSGDARSDLLVGWLDRFQQGGGEYAARRGNLGSLFIQDNYRVGRNLTINLGLRWDPFVPYGDELGRTECFLAGQKSQRFPKSPTGYVFAGDPGCPAGGFASSWWQFGPRAGFAYNVGGHGTTTIRGGFGLFFQPPFVEAFNNMVDSAPFSPQILRTNIPFGNPYTGIRNPFPQEFAPFIPASDVNFDLPLGLGVSYTPDWKPARTISYNLTIEHQLRADLLVRAAYVGSKATHLGFNTDINAARVFPGGSNIDAQERRPYQQFGQITQDVSGANSNYNSLQVGLDKRFSHGFVLGANYTFSRTIDWVSYLSDLDGINVINPFNARAYRGVSDFNVPHRFVLNYVWQLPSPKAGVLKHVLGGWETSGLWNWQSGFPLTISSGDDRSGTTIGNDNADVIGKPGYTDGSKAQRIAKWFTTESFTLAKLDTFGNAGRNILVGPGTFNIDFSAIKNFRFSEKKRLQYRAEFFNVLNHANLNNPQTSLTAGTFGRITSARDPRIIQMALKLYF